MRHRLAGMLLVFMLAAPVATLAGPEARPLEEARVRVDHHLRQVEVAAGRLGTVLREPCPSLATPKEWAAFQDAREEDVIVLLAHLEQAWAEAKAAGDDQLRRDAKAPRRRAGEGLRLLEKLQTCAAESHVSFDPLAAWTRIEREIPRRQREIALPEYPAQAR